jgi:ATP-dependent protease ClpP protease subunit
MNKWYEITNKAEAPAAEVFLYDEIGGYGIDASQFINELSQIEADELTVHINSVGGEVFAGFAIYQALKDHRANVTVHVDALAASIASVIAQAGDRVVMARNAEMMIHDGMVATMGNAAELRRAVDTLDRVSNNIASVYAERAGGEPATWRTAMQAETWYSADEAVAAGLADEVAPATKRGSRNSSDLRIFNYAGRKFAPPPVVATASEPDDGLDAASLIAALKEAFDV